MFEVWPDNWTVVMLFSDLHTQWRVGMQGKVGIDYGVLPTVFRIRGIPRRDWQVMFELLQVMESTALEVMHQSNS